MGVGALLDLARSGRSAIGPAATVADPTILDSPIGEIAGFVDNPGPRFVSLARCAVDQAIAEAGLVAADLASCDLVVGTGAGSRNPFDWTNAGRAAPSGSLADWTEQFASVARMIASETGIGGEVVVVNTACSSGCHALMHAHNLIRTGRSRRALCVGADEFWAGLHFSFKMMGALSQEACEPYRSSSGTTLAEAAGAVVLEHPDEVRRRRVRTFGAILGAGASADGYHPARPDPTGAGAELAVERALASVSGCADPVSFVFGHGTGTAANDAMETALHLRRFGPDCPLVGSKGLHGHTFGASGVIELIAALSVLTGDLLPSPSCFSPSFAFEIPSRVTAIKTSFAMGGLNTALVVTGAPLTSSVPRGLARAVSTAELAVDGTRWLDPDHFDAGAVAGTLSDLGHTLVGDPEQVIRAGDCGISSRKWSRLDLLGKLVLASAAMVLHGAWRSDVQDVGVAYATEHGPILSWALVTEAMRTGRSINPKLLPRLSHHAPLMAVTESLGLRGPAAAFVSGPASARHALEHAAMMVETGGARAMLVIAADEYVGPDAGETDSSRLFGFDPNDSALVSVHDAVAQPGAYPSVACLLITREDDDAEVMDPSVARLRLPAGSETPLSRPEPDRQAADGLRHVISALARQRSPDASSKEGSR